MAHTLGELAELVGGVVRGDPATIVVGAAPLATAAAGEITLIDSPERLKKSPHCAAAAALVPAGVELSLPTICVAGVHAAFTKLVHVFRPARIVRRTGRSPSAIVSPTARLGDDVDVHAGAIVGDDVEIGDGATIHGGAHIMAGSKIGPGVTIFPNAVLYENTIVGPRSIIHASAVLGAFGFGYRTVAGRHELTAQLGNVELGADVEVGAGTTIDRGTYGPTRVGDGTKIDDQVMIGHNCVIGRHNLICSQVGIAGSTTTGDYVVIAGQAGVRDHLHIGNRVTLGAMAGVMNDVPDGTVMLGIPATPDREQKMQMIAVAKLPEMRREFKALAAAVAELKRKLDAEAQSADAAPANERSAAA